MSVSTVARFTAAELQNRRGVHQSREIKCRDTHVDVLVSQEERIYVVSGGEGAVDETGDLHLK